MKNMDIPEVLVLGPGGIKGYQELGVLYFLESSNMLNKIRTLIGVSVGAIICLLYNIGCSVKEIIYLAVENVHCIDEQELDIIRMIRNFNEKSGLFSNQKIKDSLTNAILSKLGYVPTFRQLYELTGKELVIVTYNLTKEISEYISYRNYPDLRCLDAVLLSINIPIVFLMSTMNDCVYIDGAFGDPYPVLLKDDGITKILGIYVQTNLSNRKYESPFIYIHDVLQCLFHNMTERNIRGSSEKCKHLGLKCDIFDTVGITVTIEDKAKMVLYGINTAKNFCHHELFEEQ